MIKIFSRSTGSRKARRRYHRDYTGLLLSSYRPRGLRRNWRLKIYVYRKNNTCPQGVFNYLISWISIFFFRLIIMSLVCRKLLQAEIRRRRVKRQARSGDLRGTKKKCLLSPLFEIRTFKTDLFNRISVRCRIKLFIFTKIDKSR